MAAYSVPSKLAFFFFLNKQCFEGYKLQCVTGFMLILINRLAPFYCPGNLIINATNCT